MPRPELENPMANHPSFARAMTIHLGLCGLMLSHGCAAKQQVADDGLLDAELPVPPGCLAHAAESRLMPVALLCGEWSGKNQGRVIEETWTPARGGVMLGTSREIDGDRVAFFESMQLGVTGEGEIVYRAWPAGRGPTDFKLVEHEAGVLVFENPENDFPKRIAYAVLPDGSLQVEISAGELRRSSWRLVRTPAP